MNKGRDCSTAAQVEVFLLLAALFLPVLAVSGLAARLPGGGAVIVSFAAFFSPGLLLVLAVRKESSVAGTLTEGFAVNFAIVGILSLPAFAGEWSLDLFGKVHLCLSLGLGVLAANALRRRGVSLRKPYRSEVGLFLVLALFVEAVLLIFHSPELHVDNTTYLAYIREYLDYNRLSWREPIFESGEMVKPRMLFSFWLAGEALIVRWSGMDLYELYRNWLPVPLLALVPLAVYSLGLEVLGTRRRAVAAVAVQVLFLIISRQSLDTVGSVLYRIREDKVTAAFILFPVLMKLFLSWWKGGRGRDFFLLTAAGLGLGLAHPVIAAIFTVSATLFMAASVYFETGRTAVRRLPAAAVSLALVMLFPFLQRVLVKIGQYAVTFSISDPQTLFYPYRLRRFLILDEGRGLFIVHPVLLWNVFIVAALAAGIFLVRRLRDDAGARYLFSNLYGLTILAFVPGITAVTGRLITPWQMWRITWVIPFSLVLCYVAMAAAPRWLAEKKGGGAAAFPVEKGGEGVQVSLAALSALAVAVVSLGWGGAVLKPFPYHEVEARESLQEEDLALLKYIRGNVPPGSLMLTDNFGRYVPAFSGRVRLLRYRREEAPVVRLGGDSQRKLRRLFYGDGATGESRQLIVDRYRPDYILAESEGEEALWMSSKPESYRIDFDGGERLLFKVLMPGDEEIFFHSRD